MCGQPACEEKIPPMRGILFVCNPFLSGILDLRCYFLSNSLFVICNYTTLFEMKAHNFLSNISLLLINLLFN